MCSLDLSEAKKKAKTSGKVNFTYAARETRHFWQQSENSGELGKN